MGAEVFGVHTCPPGICNVCGPQARGSQGCTPVWYGAHTAAGLSREATSYLRAQAPRAPFCCACMHACGNTRSVRAVGAVLKHAARCCSLPQPPAHPPTAMAQWRALGGGGLAATTGLHWYSLGSLVSSWNRSLNAWALPARSSRGVASVLWCARALACFEWEGRLRRRRRRRRERAAFGSSQRPLNAALLPPCSHLLLLQAPLLLLLLLLTVLPAASAKHQERIAHSGEGVAGPGAGRITSHHHRVPVHGLWRGGGQWLGPRTGGHMLGHASTHARTPTQPTHTNTRNPWLRPSSAHHGSDPPQLSIPGTSRTHRLTPVIPSEGLCD